MILAGGLSPAWQQILVFERLQFGEVNRAVEVNWCGSGKVLNVGRALAGLAAEPAALQVQSTHSQSIPFQTLTVLGGPASAAIQAEFAADHVPLEIMPSVVPTRVCTTVLDRAADQTTELVENAAPLPPQELKSYAARFRELAATADTVILSGSLPTGAPATYFAELLGEYRGRVILDVRGPELLAALPLRPWLVKPNRNELAATFNRAIASSADLLAAMREVNDLGAKWVVVSSGSGTVWMTSDRETFRLQPPKLEHVINPIGSGDTLAAGIAWSTIRGEAPQQAVRLGIAAAAANAEGLLPARWQVGRVAELLEQVTVEKE